MEPNVKVCMKCKREFRGSVEEHIREDSHESKRKREEGVNREIDKAIEEIKIRKAKEND